MAAQQIPQRLGVRGRCWRGRLHAISAMGARIARRGWHCDSAQLHGLHWHLQRVSIKNADARGGPLVEFAPPLGQQQQPRTWQRTANKTIWWTTHPTPWAGLPATWTVPRVVRWTTSRTTWTTATVDACSPWAKRNRMRAAALSPVSQRNQLSSASNLQATGVAGADILCEASFDVDRKTICLGRQRAFHRCQFSQPHVVVMGVWRWRFLLRTI